MNLLQNPLVRTLSLLLMLTGPGWAEQSSDEQSDTQTGPIMSMRQEMTSAFFDYPLTGDADFDFATLIVSLNDRAIEMARWAIDHADDARLVSLAEEVITAKQDRQQRLRQWLERNPEPTPGNDADAVIEAFGYVRERMEQSREERLRSSEPQQAFAEAMIWHYEAAYSVAQTFLQNSVNAQLRLIATEVSRTNSRQIANFTNWLSRQ